MFVLVVAVPALLVVVLGYVVGHGLWRCVTRMLDAALGTSLVPGAGAAGWTTGSLCLAAAVRWVLVAWRARARRD